MRFTEEEIRNYLKRDEGLFLEFKSLSEGPRERRAVRDRRTVRDEIAQHVAAFANAEGGVLILGVEDDGTLSGHGYPEEALEEFAKVPRARLQPALDVDMQRIRVDGQELLVFEVPAHPVAVMVVGDGFPCRVQDTVVLDGEERINARKQAIRAVAWEAFHRTEASLDDLDPVVSHEIFRRTPHAGRPAEEVLERYGLAAVSRDGLRLSNAALVLFGEHVGRWHPRAGIRIFRVQGREREHGKHRNVTEIARLVAPLPRLITEVEDRCRAQIRRSEKLHDLFFREFPEYPTFAWQEAIINAVAHRDYAQQGRETEVWFYDDRMEISSPGELIQPVTIDELRSRRGVHASRNPLIVRVLVDAGIMREEGEGIPRMFEEMEESFLKAPQFEEFAGVFRVTLHNTPILDAGNPEWQAIIGQLALSTSQTRILVANPGGFTSGDYQKLNGVDRDQSYREIQELVTKGIVEASGGRGRAARYHVSPDLIRSRVWLEERVAALRSFFTESERLTNAKYREILGVERHRAREDLARLRDAGILEQRGEKRGTYYVPGPALELRREI